MRTLIEFIRRLLNEIRGALADLMGPRIESYEFEQQPPDVSRTRPER